MRAEGRQEKVTENSNQDDSKRFSRPKSDLFFGQTDEKNPEHFPKSKKKKQILICQDDRNKMINMYIIRFGGLRQILNVNRFAFRIVMVIIEL